MHCVPLIACALLLAPPEHIAEEITQLKIPFDDLGDALHIQRIHATLRLKEPRANWGVEVERYHDGKKQPDRGILGGSAGSASEECEFSLQAIDLDYLPLSGAPKNSSRLLTKMGRKGSTLTGSYDLPKNQGDFFFRRQKIAGVCSEQASTADRVPLALFFSSDAASVTFPGGSDPEEYKKLKNGDLLIVYLRVKP
jgi:hypothetical protein